MTRPSHHPGAAGCIAPEAAELPQAIADAVADIFAVGALLELFASSAERTADDAGRTIVRDATAADPDARPSMRPSGHGRLSRYEMVALHDR